MFEDEKPEFKSRHTLKEMQGKLKDQASQLIDFMSLPLEERLRIGWLRADLGRFKRGEISAAELRKNLTADELQGYKDRCSKPDYEDYGQVPGELKEYAEMVRKADLMNAAADRCKTYHKAVKTRNQAEHLYELALERLGELLWIDSSLRVYLDRNVIFGFDGNVGIDRVSIPRLKTSKSQFTQNRPSKVDRTAVLIDYVEHLIDAYKWS